MVFQGCAVGIGLKTEKAAVTAGLRVALVVHETASMAVSPATLPTSERPVLTSQFLGAPTPASLSMDSLVVGQLLSQAKGFPTLTTFVWFHISMDNPMCNKVGDTVEGLPTFPAFKWFFTCMNGFMVLEQVRKMKSLSTFITFERFLTTVRLLMSCELLGESEGLPTFMTFK